MPPVLVDRVVKSLRNRSRLRIMKLRGDAARRFSLGSVKAGRNLLIGRNVRLVIYGELIIGNDVILSDGCTIEVAPRGRVVLGDGVFVGRNTVIAAQRSIEIGDRVLIAEHCSVRDADHHVDPALRLTETEAVTAPVVLEPNVWIGAGVRVLRGCRVGSGSVVAANAVLRDDVPAAMIAGGIPARILGPAEDRRRIAPPE